MDIDQEEDIEIDYNGSNDSNNQSISASFFSYDLYIFDFDLTLADTIELAKVSFKYAINKCGGEYSDNEVMSYLTVPLDDTFNKIKKPNCDLQKFKEIYYEETHKHVTSVVTLYKDAVEMIKFLKECDKKLAIVTNRDRQSICGALENLGYPIGSFFDCLIGREDVVLQKPNAEPIEKCLNVMGVDKKRAIYIGDAENDGKAAFNAEVDFAYVDRFNNNYKFFGNSAKYNIKSFDELMAFDNDCCLSSFIKEMNRVATYVNDRQVVVFIGPDFYTGAEIPHYKSRKEILSKLGKNVEDIGKAEAEYLRESGTNTYLDELKSNVLSGNIKPIEYQLLTRLNFVSYICFNHDGFIEDCISDGSNVSPTIITNSEDIKKWDMFGKSKPVIFPLGDPADLNKTLFVSNIEDKMPVEIENLIINIINNKICLFVGFSEYEIGLLFEKFKDELTESNDRNYVVLDDNRCLEHKYDKDKHYTLFRIETAKFVSLLHNVAVNINLKTSFKLQPTDIYKPVVKMPEWASDLAFHPTPTEVIDAFLEHLLTELDKESPDPKERIKHIVNEAYRVIHSNKGNFASFDDLIKKILKWIDQYEGANDYFAQDLKDEISSIKYIETDKSSKITKQGRTAFDNICVKKAKVELAIGLYGFSKRVIDFLKGLNKDQINNTVLYIASCSQKDRDLNYYDELKYINEIKEKNKELSNCKIVIVSDFMLIDLLKEHTLDAILFGVHTFIVDNKKRHSFRNIDGTGLLAETAVQHGTEVFIIGEESKIVELSDKKEFKKEEASAIVYRETGLKIEKLSRRNEEVVCLPEYHFITEKGEYKDEQ